MRILLISSILVVGLFAGEWKIQNDPYYKHKVSQFEVLMDKNSDITTMMLGDSITDEGEWSELLGFKVHNRGISGDTTDGVLDRLKTVSANVKQVFIMIGVNDIMRGKSAEYVFENYKKIIKYLQEKDIKIVIQSTLYIGESRKQNFNSKIEKLNKDLKEFAKNNQIIFIDLNPIFTKNKTLLKEFTYDDLHLNGKSYILWSNELKKITTK
ncbi:GDSL-type esterase/lipase family protein [Aliarcobacter vitoriensis]|uniref:Lipolytic protein n=1 Tax=Aliarcobacter vitoriensis TaxID=2011099 RepID=A0A366MRJ6_9BACT|nr:GDSL-type esterase/lipase family protein [Aliarcobacter vitoriensis]RBQ27962.1 lipolytic protein [Aliarcobacter vitoriensis]